MASVAGLPAGANESVDTLAIGGGQAGLATSYWLTQSGVEHLVVERRNRFGGGWLDRLGQLLPGRTAARCPPVRAIGVGDRHDGPVQRRPRRAAGICRQGFRR